MTRYPNLVLVGYFRPGLLDFHTGNYALKQTQAACWDKKINQAQGIGELAVRHVWAGWLMPSVPGPPPPPPNVDRHAQFWGYLESLCVASILEEQGLKGKIENQGLE